MSRLIVLFAFITVALTPGGAAGQDPEARIETARRTVAEAGIATSLIDSRVAEGRAKGVPLERIAAVVERRAANLVMAREAMAAAPALSAADLAAGADALEAGIDRGSLRAVIEGARVEDRPVAIAVLTYLHREAGLPVGQALQRVRAAMGEGPEALRTLPSRAAATRGHTGPPPWAGEPGGRPGAGAGKGGGPPAGVPAPGEKPGRGKPDDPGRGSGGRPENPGGGNGRGNGGRPENPGGGNGGGRPPGRGPGG